MTETHHRYEKTRALTNLITAPLFVEDYCIQSSPEVSPPKWHLGHTSWFFEYFVLAKFLPDYQAFNPALNNVFNSYYKQAGPHWKQEERGALSRPGVSEINEYRKHVDHGIIKLLNYSQDPDLLDLVTLGIHHEQQHQELLYMDIKNILFQQYHPQKYWGMAPTLNETDSGYYIEFDKEIVEVGHSGSDFAFDCEKPAHGYLVNPFKMRSTLVTNREYLQFVEGDGYRNSTYWHSDGWNWIQSGGPHHPLYWKKKENHWFEYDFAGTKELQLDRPVSHISYYEAAAFAQFSKKRLPTEQEWEHAAKCKDHLFKDLQESLWQWTSSAYGPYPGHSWASGPLGEYNSKFMVNQIVLRGGSAWTPANHTRATYRNFYYPDKRWPFTGIRLAEDYHAQ